MRFHKPKSESGIAMVIVMVTIIVLGVMAASFSYSMKVEMTLAYNGSLEPELEWVARSGVEYARWYLSQQELYLQEMGQTYHALNQPWAGAPVIVENYFEENPIPTAPLKNVQLGAGTFSLTLTDAERKFNINVADELILNQAMALMGLSASDSSVIVNSILDWRDLDSDPLPGGAEADEYLRKDPPYYAKDGPIDDLSELLLIEGVMPEMYWGPHPPVGLRRQTPDDEEYLPVFPVGLVDLFTPIAEPRINVNTTTAEVLMLLPGMEENWALSIIEERKGPDGVDGTEDDTPYASVMELPLPPQINSELSRFLAVRSTNFKVLVDAQVGSLKKQYVALLRFNSGTDIQVLYMHEK